MKIVSLLLCKLYGPRLKVKGKSACHCPRREKDLILIYSAYVEINVAGNGYRGHGIAVPARSYAQDFGSLIQREPDKTRR